jgi:CoA:oxalate CoA-transferase
MSGPLSGIKVLSFCRMLSGPYTTMLLSDLGADVVKVEEPKDGDFPRNDGPFIEGISSYFLSVNRGKRSITLDLKKEGAKKIIFELVKKVDILLENFRPGVMARLGFDYSAIRKHNPEIIYASISGFGQKGPYAERAAFDMIAQGMGGVLSLTGEAGRPPVRVGYSVGDMGASLFAAVAILAALQERSKSGKGQWIDVSMLDCQVALCENACARYFATLEIPGPLGSRHPLFTPFQVFPTADSHVVLIASLDDHWKKFCVAVGKEDWISDERFNSNESRLKNYEAFVDEMNTLMRTRTTKEWMELFARHGIIHGPVNTIDKVVTDPHILEREMIVEVLHPRAGKLRVVGTPMKFSRTPCKIEKACPDLGENTEEVLTSWLGLSSEEIDRLRKSKTV